MKNIIILAAVLAVAAVGYWIYSSQTAIDGSDVQNDVNESELSEIVMANGTYTANTDSSTIEWEAGKPAIAGYVHHGTFSLKSGSISLSDNELSGTFVIDVESLKVTSLGGGKAGQESALEGHLKNEGFFDTARYPTAEFTITDVSPKVKPGPEQSEYNAKGQLTIKGQTHEIEFPMRVTVNNENVVKVLASLDINRTLWGVSFGSSSVVENITDQVIGDTVAIDLAVELKK